MKFCTVQETEFNRLIQPQNKLMTSETCVNTFYQAVGTHVFVCWLMVKFIANYDISLLE